MKIKTLVISMLVSLFMTGCSILGEFNKIADVTKKMSPAELYNEGKQFLDVQDFPNAITYFEILESRYPFGIYSTQAMLDLAYAHYAFNQNAEAITEANRFIRLYPNHGNVDYAFYLRALSNFETELNIFTKAFGQDTSRYDITKLKQSFDDFTLIINRYPNSKYAKDSRNRLIYLKNKMAANELYIAQYYRKRFAHVAAIERVKYMLDNYSGTPSVENGLILLIESYNDLGIYDSAYDAGRVLTKNFSNYKIIQSDTSKPIKIQKNKTNLTEK